MQTFVLPKGMLDRMDTNIRRFFWGKAEDTRHSLYLKAWADICMPKAMGGLGVRRMRDTNLALITKLAWTIHCCPTRTWVQLIRSKYLRGRQILDVERTATPSWIWGGIKQCLGLLRLGCVYQISAHSTARIVGDPWLPHYPNFRIPNTLRLPATLTFVKDLLDNSGTQWDMVKLGSFFPQPLRDIIADIPILEMEQDRLIWLPLRQGHSQ